MTEMVFETPADRFARMLSAAAEAGLNIAYSPAAFADEKEITLEEWHQYRTTGIGGSDAGIIMKTNTFGSLTALARKKEGYQDEEEITPEKRFIFDSGHAMEPVVGNLFSAKTGFTVFEDSHMYRHPLYPYMIADCDLFCTDAAGMTCGVELKCTGSSNRLKWRSGIYGQDARVGVMSYITQCQHYMAVMNLDRWYLAVGVANEPEALSIIRVDRDCRYEKFLIEQEGRFWSEYVEKGLIPLENAYAKDEYDRIRSAWQSGTADEKPAVFAESFRRNLDELWRLSEQKSELNRQVRALEEKENALRLPLIAALGSSVLGYLAISSEERYEVSYKSPKPRVKFDTDRLKLAYPEIYARLEQEGFIKTVQSRPTFLLKTSHIFRRS